MLYYVAKPVDFIPDGEGALFKARILGVHGDSRSACLDAKGRSSAIVVTDPHGKDRIPRKHPRQQVFARVEPVVPGGPRYTAVP